jgi:hypothetical protein
MTQATERDNYEYVRDAVMRELAEFVEDGESDEESLIVDAIKRAADAIRSLKHQRRLLAMLAAPTPQFFNPILAAEVVTLRDRILAGAHRQNEEAR